MSAQYRTFHPELWDKPFFRDLTRDAQHTYLLLITHPDTTSAGTLDWLPGRLAALTKNLTAEDVAQAAQQLETAGLLVVDCDTDEAALTRWFRDTTILKQPALTKNAIRTLNHITSPHIPPTIAQVIADIAEQPTPPNGIHSTEVQDFLTRHGHDPHTHPAQAPAMTSGNVWTGHPGTVSDPSEARCREHAGVVGPVVGCVACGAARRLAVGWLGGG